MTIADQGSAIYQYDEELQKKRQPSLGPFACKCSMCGADSLTNDQLCWVSAGGRHHRSHRRGPDHGRRRPDHDRRRLDHDRQLLHRHRQRLDSVRRSRNNHQRRAATSTKTTAAEHGSSSTKTTRACADPCGAATHSMASGRAGSSEALIVATEAAGVKCDMIRMKNGVRQMISDQGPRLLYDREIAEWPLETIFEHRLEGYCEALPAEESGEDMEIDKAEPGGHKDDGDQAYSEKHDAERNPIELDNHDAEDPLPERRIEVSQTVMRGVGRLHPNLKHPSKLQLVRALRHGGATDIAIEAAKRLRCATCEELARPRVGRTHWPAKLRMSSKFGNQVALDLFVVHTTSGGAQEMLNITDVATSFQVVVPVTSKRPAEIAHLFETGWCSWAGVPESVMCDNGGEF